jgi:hypothetical protein
MQELRSKWKSLIVSNRQTGKTQATIDMASMNPKVIVVCATNYLAQLIQKKLPDNTVISINQIDQVRELKQPYLFEPDAVALLIN